MGTVPPKELLKKWECEEITVEMAVGHILQNLVQLMTIIEAFKTSLRKLRTDVDSLIAHTGMSPRLKGKRKPPKKG
jgi:hypothetical protein